MHHNYVVVKQTKSLGLAILLTLVFGPIGLFYASVVGGLVMCFTPIIVVVIGLISADSSTFLSGFFLFIVFYALFWWLICIIWAAIAVSSYNSKIMKEAYQFQSNYSDVKVLNETYDNHYNSPHQKGKLVIQSRPNPEDWLKENPGKGLNDYYNRYGA